MGYRLLLTLLTVSLAARVTLTPGNTLTISGCTTRLELVGNDVRCIAASPTPTRTPSPTRTPTRTRTATRTITPNPPTLTATLVPSATPSPLPTATVTATDLVEATATPSATAAVTAAVTATPSATTTALPSSPVPTATVCTPTPSATQTGALIGLAIIGDSTQDEYAAPENNRPAVNWVEHLARQGLPVGVWGSWGGSRRTGYEFNWARSGAVAAGGLYDQAPGVVSQIQAGRVSHVLIQIGINDFNAGLMQAAYSGQPVSSAAIDAIADAIVETARLVGVVAPGRVILAPTQDYLGLDLAPDPENGLFSDAAGRARAMAVAADLNARMLARLPAGVIWYDWNAAMAARLAQVRQGDVLILNDQSVFIRQRGSQASNGFVLDAYMHPETAISGLYAQLYLEEMNAVWGLNLPALTDAEIMLRAQ